MKVVALVPIKLNNERLPGKNTKPFTNGNPLISYILDTIAHVPTIDASYVYCSSEDIRHYLPSTTQYLARPDYLDLSSTPFIEVLTSFAERVDADVYVLTHATAPFISATSISLGIDKVKSGAFDSAFSVVKMQEFLWDKNGPVNYTLDHIPRTQDLPDLFVETCGLYIYTKDLILNHRRRIGSHPYQIEVTKKEAIDINDEGDFMLADAMFNLKY